MLHTASSAVVAATGHQPPLATAAQFHVDPVRRVLDASPPVSWVQDAGWIEARFKADLAASPSTAGCCPVSVLLNGKRDGSRCCAAKRQAGRLKPLRPVGGATWATAAAQLRNGTRLLVSGDSMEQQLFVALLCSAWAEPSFRIQGVERENAQGCARGRVEHVSTGWRLDVAWCLWLFDLRKNRLQGSAALVDLQVLPPPATLPLSVRWGGVEQGSASPLALLRSADALLVGGWHHGVPRVSTVIALLRLLARAYPSRWIGTIEATPIHFPGNIYRASGVYPPATPDEHAACNDNYVAERAVNHFKGHPTLKNLGNSHLNAFNVELAERVNQTNAALLATSPRGQPRVGLIATRSLYHSRGDAHADDTGLPQHTKSSLGLHSWKSFSAVPRDCLHFCHTPGVLDALALVTLAELLQPGTSRLRTTVERSHNWTTGHRF